MSDRTLYFLLGMSAGMLLFYIIKTLYPSTKPCDDGEEIPQQIMDKLNKAITDIKSTI